ncbi:MAG: hypothetical protein GXP14_15480 [Gammaproteobacteria bacterium]|nr:hypothetical protein [Gammaproteobacteria bacterium]
MLSYLIEAVTLAFFIGSLLGALVAYHFSCSHFKAQQPVESKTPRQ